MIGGDTLCFSCPTIIQLIFSITFKLGLAGWLAGESCDQRFGFSMAKVVKPIEQASLGLTTGAEQSAALSRSLVARPPATGEVSLAESACAPRIARQQFPQARHPTIKHEMAILERVCFKYRFEKKKPRVRLTDLSLAQWSWPDFSALIDLSGPKQRKQSHFLYRNCTTV